MNIFMHTYGRWSYWVPKLPLGLDGLICVYYIMALHDGSNICVYDIYIYIQIHCYTCH